MLHVMSIELKASLAETRLDAAKEGSVDRKCTVHFGVRRAQTRVDMHQVSRAIVEWVAALLESN